MGSFSAYKFIMICFFGGGGGRGEGVFLFAIAFKSFFLKL